MLTRTATYHARLRFAAWFKEVCEEKGKPLRAVAKELRMDPGAMTRWAQAETLPSTPVLLRVARWGHISEAELLMLVSEDIP